MTREGSMSRRNGLGVLYALEDGGDRLKGVPGRDRTADARERYWIERVKRDKAGLI